MEKFRQAPALKLRASIDASTLNREERTVEVVFATETPVRMYSWDIGPYNEILSFKDGHVRWDRINSGAPVLDNHQRYGKITDVQIGVVERAWAEKKTGRAKVRFSKREEVEAILNDIEDGIIRNISVGYGVHKYEDESKKGESVRTLRAIDWEPAEVSFVTVPADYTAGVRSKEDAAIEVEIISKTNIGKMEENEVTQPAAESQERAKPVETAPAVDENAVRAAAVAGERKRAADIFTAVRKAKLGEDFAEKLISDGVTVEKAREMIIEKWAEGQSTAETNSAQTANVEVRADEADKLRSAVTNALVLRSGQVAEKEFKADEISAANEFRGATLLDLAKDSLERDGVNTRGMGKMEIAKRAITSSTADFPVLLEGANRRVLLSAYQATADTWRNFCAVGSVGDFREYKRLRLGSFSRLDKLAENDEYRNKRISDAEYEKVSAETFGNVINVSRKMIINDDLNGFARLSAQLGRAAARSIEIDVYALLASNPTLQDGTALFHADHGNLVAGAALSVEAIDAARVAMASQKEPGGNDFIDLRPSILLCPIGMGGNARVINDAQYDPDTPNKLQKPNKVRGLYSDIVDTPRLSGTAWYSFANPSEEPVIEVSFLDGVQTPYMESMETFDIDGIKWKVRLDYGVGAVGFRGAVMNPGA